MDYKILQNILQCVLHKYIFTIHIHNAITKICFRIRNSVFFFLSQCADGYSVCRLRPTVTTSGNNAGNAVSQM